MTKEELYQELAKMGPEMPSGERMAKYFQGEEVDCQPYGTYTLDWTYATFWGYGKSALYDFEKYCEIVQLKKEHYGVNAGGFAMDGRTLGHALGSKVVFPENGMEYVKEHVMKDYSMLDDLKDFDVRKNEVLMGIIEDTKRLKERFPDMMIASGCPGPLTSATSVRATDLILRDMRRNPEDLHRLLDFCTNVTIDWIRIYTEETGCASMMIADPVASTDVLGVKLFHEFAKPYLKRLFDAITEICGSKPMMHICGHTKGFWDALVEMGVEHFSIDDRESLLEAKEILGSKMLIQGNISPVDFMRKGTIDEVIEEVKRQLREAADSPCGFILSPGCEVPAGSPKENVDALIYAVRKYGAGARLGHLPKGLEQA